MLRSAGSPQAGRFDNEQSLFYAAQITCIFECSLGKV